MTRPLDTGQVTVRIISAEQHVAFLRQRASASFLQTPAWALVKSGWRSESIGWYAGDLLVGVALVLYRSLPPLRRSLAYVPEGPVIDWATQDMSALLDPMVAHVKARGAFGIRIGPPVITRIWESATVKAGLSDRATSNIVEVPPDQLLASGTRIQQSLRAAGWHEPQSKPGFDAGQPRYVFQIPLAGRCSKDVLAGMNQQWRRNIKQAHKCGVAGSVGMQPDIAPFHRLDRIRLYLAHHEGDLVAAALWIRVGDHVWYSYGASASSKRSVCGSNAVQWRMIQDALAEKATVYDLRGITDTLTQNHPSVMGVVDRQRNRALNWTNSCSDRWRMLTVCGPSAD